MAESHVGTPSRPRLKAGPGIGREATLVPRDAPAHAERISPRRRPFELIGSAKEQLLKLTGYGIDSVSAFAKSDSGWHLAVTVVELHRIPAATDVLAIYEVDLDEVGDIVSYHRGRRFFRDQVGDEA